MVLKLRNAHLDFLFKLLEVEKLGFSDGRKRNKFLKILTESFNDYEKGRKDLLSKLGKKDENGQLVINEKKEVEFENEEAKIEFVAELNNLFNELVIIDETEANKEVLQFVKELVTREEFAKDAKLSGQEVELLEGILESFKEYGAEQTDSAAEKS